MEQNKNTSEVISVENLNIAFKTDDQGSVPAVRGVTFKIDKGEVVGLVGESGCGKSVTALSIMKLLSPSEGYTSGDIKFDGLNLNHLSEKNMRSVRGSEMSMIFQEPMTSLNPVHKIGKQIAEVMKLHSSLSRTELRTKAIEMIEKVGIPRANKVVDEYPHQLSGGMRQRIMIAMAMVCKPKLLIADEPTTALDVTIQAQILDLMNEIKEDYGTSVLLITHDLGVVAEMADRVFVMYYGQIVEYADVKTLFKHPKHPYTMGLLDALPTLEGKEQIQLKAIKGNVPSLGEIRSGCPFRSRCPYAFEKCFHEDPPFFDIGEQEVRCWLYQDKEVSS